MTDDQDPMVAALSLAHEVRLLVKSSDLDSEVPTMNGERLADVMRALLAFDRAVSDAIDRAVSDAIDRAMAVTS